VYQDKYIIQIYLKGAVIDRPLHGPVEYLQGKAILGHIGSEDASS
jgi:hypothetical protein